MSYTQRNPWGLTDAEQDAICAMAEAGVLKRAAAALGLTESCVQSRLRGARLRMAGHKPSARLIVRCEPLPTITACARYAAWAAHPSQWGAL